ncbi:hypothetical protein ACWV0C_005226, partial [Escherichia coli]
YKYRRGAKGTSGMGIMSCLKFFWCLYAIRQSLSGIVHFCDAAWIASHTTFYQLHPCNKSTTLDKITKFYLIPH